jgi:hypothetical protein
LKPVLNSANHLRRSLAISPADEIRVKSWWELSLFSSPEEVSSVSSVSSDHFEELGGAQETQEETGKNLTSLPERHKAPSFAPWHPVALGIHAEHPDWYPHQIALHLGQGFERINGRVVKALLDARQ